MKSYEKLGPRGFCHICNEPDYGGHNHTDAEICDYVLHGFLPEKKIMHYANGREAKNGDKIVVRQWNGTILSGILYDAVPGNDYCNGKIAVISNDLGVNLKECLHVDDIDIGILKPKPAEEPK